MRRLLILFLLALFAAAPLGACGKKGPPEAPPGEEGTYSRQYPSV
jgi:predicted small lipoprotein YifL